MTRHEPTPPPFPSLAAGDAEEELVLELDGDGRVRHANRPAWAAGCIPHRGDPAARHLTLEGGGLAVALDRSRRHRRTETVIGRLLGDGGETPVAGGLVPLLGSDGDRGWLLALRPGPDLPTRLLETSPHTLVRAIEQTDLGITLTDREGRIVYANRAEAEMHGYAPQELVGLPASDLGVPGADGPPPEEPGSPWVRTRVNRRRDGERFPVRLVSNQIRDWEGRLLGRLTISEDVSRPMRLTRMKEEFIRVAAHELRTPLTSILTALALLRDPRQRGEEARAEALAIAERNARHLLGLVHDLFDFQKAISGNLEIAPEPVAAVPLLRAAAERATGEQPGRSPLPPGRVVADLDHGLAGGGPWVSADPGRLLQVLDHLLSNALRHSPADQPVRLGVVPGSRRTTLTVVDRGPGLPEELRRRLFEPFSQGDASTTRSGSGTGLGLALAKALVEGMDGELEILTSSDAGSSGTTALVHLPAARPPAGVAEQDAAPSLVKD